MCLDFLKHVPLFLSFFFLLLPVVPIVTVEKDEFNIQVHHENLQQILDLPQLYKTKVAVIGISGKSQSGKSFLLDVIKLFLQEKVNIRTLIIW